MNKVDLKQVRKRFPALDSTGPRCRTCGRRFGDVFEVPRVTVLAVEALESDDTASDWMARGDRKHRPAKSLPQLLKTRSMIAYVETLSSLVGQIVKPSALEPSWWRATWPPPTVPGAPKKPSDYTYWTLGFRTKWQARGAEATLTVNATIGGHSLGGKYGPVMIEAAPIVQVRVRTHVTARDRSRR